MRLNKLKLKNFRNYKELEIDLYEDNSRLEIRVQYHVPDIEANNE